MSQTVHWNFTPYLEIIIARDINVHKPRFNTTSKVAEIRPFLYIFVAQEEDTSWTA